MKPKFDTEALLAVVAGLVPATADQIGAALGQLSVKMGELGDELAEADLAAVEAVEAYELAYDIAYIEEFDRDKRLGYLPMAKSVARVATADLRLAAEVAKAQVRKLQNAIKTLDRRIDVGRTQAATVRSEHRTLGYGSAA